SCLGELGAHEDRIESDPVSFEQGYPFRTSISTDELAGLRFQVGFDLLFGPLHSPSLPAPSARRNTVRCCRAALALPRACGHAVRGSALAQGFGPFARFQFSRSSWLASCITFCFCFSSSVIRLSSFSSSLPQPRGVGGFSLRSSLTDLSCWFI